jgi:hypothetical protein
MSAVRNNLIKIIILSSIVILTSHPLSARIYSAKYLEINKGWTLEFKEGPKLTFTGVGNKRITFTWKKGKSSPWLSERNHTIAEDPFTELKTKELREMIDSVYNAKLVKWQQEKRLHDQNEENRHERESKIYTREKTAFYNRLETEYLDALRKWNQDKKQFALHAQKGFEERTRKWEIDRDNFEKDENQRIADEIKTQKEQHQGLLDEWEDKKAKHGEALADYKKDYNEYKIELKERKQNIKKCVLEGNLRSRCKVENPMPKRPKKPRFSIPKPEFVQRPVPRKPFSKPKPIKAVFKEPEPIKSKAVFPDPAPLPPRRYPVPMPQPDSSPVYGVTGLILHLSKTGCRRSNFILKKQNSIAYIKTRPELITTGDSPWEGKGTLKRCHVIGREEFARDNFFNLLIDNGNRPVEVEFNLSMPFHLKRITHPILESFQRELLKRVLKVREIDEFTKRNNRMNYDPINARYYIENEGKWVFLSYEVIGKNKRKGIKKLTMDIPQYLVDPSHRDKSFRVKRISLMDHMRKGNATYLRLKRNYWYPASGKQNNWQFKADYKFGLVRQDKLRNIIKVIQKDNGNNNSENEINSAGIVYDFTSLWYLLPWLQRTSRSEMNLTYFDDTRVFGRILKRMEHKKIPHFDNYNKTQKMIEVDRWILEDSKTGDQLSWFLVGTRDRIIYQANIEGKRFKLKTVDTERILENRKWKQDFKKQHNIVEFQ